MSGLRYRKIGEALNVESLGGETREGFGSTGLLNRLKRYGSARENALQYSIYLEQVGEQALSDDLRGCGNFATFREYFTIGQTRLSQICTCKKHLLCPLCAIRRGAKALRVYLGRVEHLMGADNRLKPFLVTFTVKNGGDLHERQKHLASCLRLLHRRRSRRNVPSETFKASAAVWSYELTNKGKGWHPHVHAIWLCHEAPDENKLRDEWHSITGDSFMVDVSPVDMTDPIGGFLEVFKYALKFSDLADADRLHAYKVLKGKRLQDSFGDLRGLDIEPNESDELLDDLPYIERLFRFLPGIGYVQVGQVQHDNQTADDRMMLDLAAMGWADEKILAFMFDRKEARQAGEITS